MPRKNDRGDTKTRRGPKPKPDGEGRQPLQISLTPEGVQFFKDLGANPEVMRSLSLPKPNVSRAIICLVAVGQGLVKEPQIWAALHAKATKEGVPVHDLLVKIVGEAL